MTILKAALFTLLVPGLVLVALPLLALARSNALSLTDSPLALAAGGLLCLIGAALYFTCLAEFVHRGRGTPAPTDPPRRLVGEGPYRYSRNPMYLAALSIVLGEALLLGSKGLLAYSAALFLAFHLFVVLYEEPTLTRKFPEEYRAYRRSVPRWVGLRRREPTR
jgi:protein-S-isoprenylcysteine O-methyltransferase Ste14